jgi:quinol monooxygenase YgiN
MIVVFATGDGPTADREAFHAWFLPLVQMAREEEGCIVYNYSVDPVSGRVVIVEAWESQETFDVHLTHPGHVEMLAVGSRDWNMGNATVHMWMHAEGHTYAERARVDEIADDRSELADLVRRFGDE